MPRFHFAHMTPLRDFKASAINWTRRHAEGTFRRPLSSLMAELGAVFLTQQDAAPNKAHQFHIQWLQL